MIEFEESLRTWELLHLPVEGETTAVRRLPDHRLHYLDYEGPVSSDRGHVIGWEREKRFGAEQKSGRWRSCSLEPD